LHKIIETYGDKSQFNNGEYNESLAFEDGDLFLTLHNAYITVIGNKQKNDKWNLDIACNVVNEYNITIKFKLENWEV